MSDNKPRRMTRREFLQTSALVSGGVALGSLLHTDTAAAATRKPFGVPALIKAAPTGKMIYGQAEPPTSAQWDDQTVFGLVDFQVASLVQDRLMEFDENMKIVPRLATNWKFIDEKTLEIDLRKGIKYHNGESFNADVVKAVIERVAKNTKLAHNAFWAPVDVEIVNDSQVRIHANPPFGPLLSLLAITSMPPKSFIDNPDQFKAADIGCGPFRFVDYKNNQVTLEANEAYWDGAPGLKTIVFDYIEDANARVNALLAGDVDLITRCSAQQLAAIKGNDKFTVVENSPAISVVLIYQHNSPIIANKKIRQAMMYAVDRKTILEKIMEGVGKYSDNIIPTSALFYQPLAEKYEYNPQKAKDLIKASGLSGSVKLKMSTSTLVPKQKEIDLTIVQYLNDVGIEVDLTTLEVGQFRTTYPQYDLSLNTFGSPGGDPDFILGVYAGPIGEAVFHLQDNPDIKAFQPLHDKQRQQTDPDKRKAAIKEACDWLWDFQPTLVLSDELWPFIVSKRISGYKRNRTFAEPLARYATAAG